MNLVQTKKFTQRSALLILLVLLAGCFRHRDLVNQAKDEFWAGNLALAAANYDKAIEQGLADEDVLKLDRAMVRFQSADFAECERLLQDVRDNLDQRQSLHVGKAALSYLADENTREYAGDDHEQILIRVMLTLANLASDGGDAIAYSHQTIEQCHKMLAKRADALKKIATEQEKQNLQDKNNHKNNGEDSGDQNVTANVIPKQPVTPDIPDTQIFQQIAIAPYLSGIVREATHRNHDDTMRNFKIASDWRPESILLRSELERVNSQRHSAPGNGVAYVFALVGRGPYKVEVAEPATSQALLIADRIISAAGDYSLPPTIAPVKISKWYQPLCDINHLSVTINNQRIGKTQTVADVGQLALLRQQEQMPQILARAVARRVVKKSLVYSGKSAANVDNDLLSLAIDLFGVAWEATESADLRCWSTLPATIQVSRFELPVGEYEFMLQTVDRSGAFGPPFDATITIRDGHNAYIIASAPDAHTGRVVNSSYPK